MKTKKAQIDNFLSQSHIAVAGYSVKSKKFGNEVFYNLKKKGYDLFPVNPAGGSTQHGDKIYENLSALPAEVKAIYIAAKPEITQKIVAEALELGFTHFWVQQFSDNAEVKEMLKNVDEKVLGQCILMHTQPAGIHKFHWWIVKMIGRLPA